MEHLRVLLYRKRMFSLSEVSLVAGGGAIGATLRFIVGRFCDVTWESTKFPIATFFVNIVGCFLIGVIAGLSVRDSISPLTRLFVVTGILGGFTTFSAFGLETITLLRGGHLMTSLLYILGSVAGGCVGVMIGLSFTEPSSPLSWRPSIR